MAWGEDVAWEEEVAWGEEVAWEEEVAWVEAQHCHQVLDFKEQKP